MGLIVGPCQIHELKREAMSLLSISLDDRQICELELLLSGAYHPLRGFMNRADYESVLNRERLSDETLWPVPVVLDLEPSITSDLKQGQRIVLHDDEGTMLAILTVGDVWLADLRLEREILDLASSTTDKATNSSMDKATITYVGGSLEGISLPVHFAYPDLRKTPQQLNAELTLSKRAYTLAIDPGMAGDAGGFRRAVKAAIAMDAQVVLHPAIGASRPTDLFLLRQIKRFRELLTVSAMDNIVFALLPLMTRAQSSKELLRRAIVHRNYGAHHLVFDPAALGFEASAASIATIHDLDACCRKELGITLMPIGELPLEQDPADYADTNSGGAEGVQDQGKGAAEPIDFPAQAFPQQGTGFTCFFTGLSGAGKSTIARALAARISSTGRPVSLLDGDVVRQNLSSELTFSQEHRDLNIRRIGYVAGEITRHGGVAICAPIAPYRHTREAVRATIEEVGCFLEIHISTPLSICELRDCKGLYHKARAGLIKNFTGISDPYEKPLHPDIRIDASLVSSDEAAEMVLQELWRRGYWPEGQASEAISSQGPERTLSN